MKFFFLFQLALVIAVFSLGTYCVNYDFAHTLHHTIPAFWAFVVNVLTGGLSITVAIILKILILLQVIKG